MKKILMLMVVALVAISVKAINLDEAYSKLTKIPGATLSDVPENECKKEGMDWGKVITFISASKATISKVDKVLTEITAPIVVDETVQDNNHVIGYAAKQKNGRTRAIVSVNIPNVGLIIVYAQGDDDVVSGMNVN